MQDEQLENYVVRGRLKRAANGDYLDIRRTSSGKAWTVLLPYRQDGTLTQRSFSSWVEAALALGKARSRWWDDDEPVLAHHKKKR